METSRDLLKVYEINHNGFENFHTNFHALFQKWSKFQNANHYIMSCN